MAFDASNVKDAESLFFLLLNAERAWAYASELKEDLSNTREMRVRYHLVKRMRKASQWAEKLMELCHLMCDDRSSLESDAYFFFMSGCASMEISQWVLSDSSTS